jgi:hypothetical protein
MKNLPDPRSVVKVGDGRGFIAEYRVERPRFPRKVKKLLPRKFSYNRVVITAAHCLPNLPPAHPAAYSEERTFPKLVSTLDGSMKDIWTECLFADPVADIAVLGSVDGQELCDQSEAYDALVEAAPIMRIDAPRSGKGYLLSLKGKWTVTPLQVFRSIGGTSLAIGPTLPGQSGSPILNTRGKAIGVVSLGGGTVVDGKHIYCNAGPQPILTKNLPAWMLR